VQCSLVGLFVLFSSAGRAPLPVKEKPQAVTFHYLDPTQWKLNRGRSAPPDDRQKSRPVSGQVVDVVRGNNLVPTESKYLAENDNRVKRETRAREQTNKYSVATAKTTAHPEALPAARGAAPASERRQATTPIVQDRFLGGLLPKYSLLDEVQHSGSAEPTEVAKSPGVENGEAQTTRSGDAAESGGGAPNDDLHEVAEGDGTALNTREWKFASFFNRVKQAVSAKWDPKARLRAHNEREVGYVDRVTVLHVTLRPDGTLVEAVVAQTCGLDWLDLEAVHSFEQAQPFPNPPRALVEQGAIRFRFTFNVTNAMELGATPRFMPTRQ
jgi:outer membrane biosynthesis protein TonB